MLPAVESWPGLSHTLLQHVLAEIQNSRGKSKGPDAALQRVVKKLYQCAEDVRRSGRPGMLLRRCQTLTTPQRPELANHFSRRFTKTSPVLRCFITAFLSTQEWASVYTLT